MSKRTLMASRNTPIIQDQNLNIHKEVCGKAGVHASKGQQQKGPGIRKALANITNSEKLPLQVPKKNHSIKHTNVGIPLKIEDERCLHNHQQCIDSRTALTSMQQHHFQKIFGVVDDANSPLDLWSPKTPLMSSRGKLGTESTPKCLEFTQTPALKLQASLECPTPWSPFSPLLY